MEATALSVGKAVLGGALGYAKSFVADEIALQLGVEKDVVFITDELEMMLAFLMAADEEQDKHKVLLTWVKQVREAAYNVEDSLMDFSVHSDKRPSCWWCVPRALWERRDIAKEVKELRTRVEDVSNRNLRYRLIKGSSGSKPTTTAEEQANVASTAISGINEAKRTAMDQEKPKMDLCQLINDGDKDLRVIAMWGETGNFGKISAIKEVYDNTAVNANFGLRAWVRLMQPFDPKEFVQSIVRQFYENFPEKLEKTHKRKTVGVSVSMRMESMSQSEMNDVFDTQVSNNSYLIIIDGLSTIMEWNCIRKYFPDNTKGSRIIVATQEYEIASVCIEKPFEVSELKQLPSHQTLYLFHKKVVRPFDSIGLSATEKNSAMPNNEIQEEEEQKPRDAGGDKDSDSGAGKKFGHSKTMVRVDEVLHGRKTEKSKLIELVGQPDDKRGLKVISVWGMGGIGKTTLVQSVYRSQQLGRWKCAWATAVRPFNPELLIRRLGADLGLSKMELKELTKKITELLNEEKCLIVLDDISSIAEWDLVRGCLQHATRIIITTRENSIAKYCSREGENIYNLSVMNDDIALELFKNKVFKDEAETIRLSTDMMEQASCIIKKCDGLPLAISTIGGFLATRPKTATEWRKINDHINVELEMSPELRTIKTVLVRSYDGLPYHLKACFLYLSIFPEGHKIRRKQLIRRWVAEGYAREMPGMTAEEVGDKYFEELLDRSMILPGEEVNIFSGKIGSCELHDIMRQICISKAREENLSFTLEGECGLSSSNTQGAVRHLAISSSWTRDKDVFDRILDLAHLRSLTVFGKWISFFISEKMRFLRVLDLEGMEGIMDHHLNQIGELIHLKYISLRGCGDGIEKLPNSLENLRNLQTLDVRQTGVYKLPPYITNLQKLRFVRTAPYEYSGAIVPRGIGKLNALCTLAHVRAGVHEKGNDTLEELSQLYQLRKLGIIDITGTNSKEFWSAIASINLLVSLSVNWTSSRSLELDSSLGGSLLPPRSIEILKLNAQLVRLPEWIHQLQNLSRLHLWRTELQQDAIEAIGKLPNLAILFMRPRSFKGEELVFKQLGSFPSLVLLDLTWIGVGDILAFVKFEDGTMPKLELLQIYGWEELQELSGLRYLASLKEIRLIGFANCEQFKDNVQEQLQVAVASNPNNNVRILREDRNHK